MRGDRNADIFKTYRSSGPAPAVLRGPLARTTDEEPQQQPGHASRPGNPPRPDLLVTPAAGAGLARAAHQGPRPQTPPPMGGEPPTTNPPGPVVVGDLLPVSTTDQAPGNGVPTALPFTFALVLTHGLPLAALLQASATAVAGSTRGHAPHRIAFNAAQYTLSLGVADAVLRLI